MRRQLLNDLRHIRENLDRERFKSESAIRRARADVGAWIRYLESTRGLRRLSGRQWAFVGLGALVAVIVVAVLVVVAGGE